MLKEMKRKVYTNIFFLGRVGGVWVSVFATRDG